MSEEFLYNICADCPNPYFNQYTDVVLVSDPNQSPITKFPLGTQLRVSCQTGYGFNGIEYQDQNFMDAFEPLDETTMTCLPGGRWDKRYMPLCERE